MKQSWLILGAVGVLILDLIFPLTLIRQPFAWSLRLTQPLQIQLQQLVSSPINIARQLRLNNELITNLQGQNAQLRASQGELEILRQENEQLRAQVNSATVSAVPVAQIQQVARVFGNGGLTYIDKGAADGIQSKQILFVQNVMVGQVTEVDQYFSQVQLIRDGQLKVVAKTIQGANGLVFTQRGKLLLSEVPSNEPLSIDQNVFSAGSTTSIVPPNLFLGKVVEIVENPQSPTKTARLETGLEKLSYTIVVVKGW